ncbi:hypothetical protein AOCH_003714 [Aspergillus ochraceoroseus]|uniref:Uncharacterized protein n=2 Tax=Aspergillus ochraceoroseus TaxID=138278 RepID=A0A0F8WKS7_9EURO|nr:hypothetical protein AOCH_003714 [Aspergillus ochraceoroseus]
MRFLSVFSGLLLAGAAVAQNSSCSPTSSDADVVKYAWVVQSLLERFYSSQPLNTTFLSDATNSSHAEYYANLQGIQRQNRLGVRAIQLLSGKVPDFSPPSCTFTTPNSTSGEDFVRNALDLESSASAAFIGATGYTQSPEVSFILSRLAAQHAADAAWLAGEQTGVVFPTNTTSLIPAYNPSYVLSNGTETGKLGQYLGGCVTPPTSPCGQFFIGSLIGSLGNATAASAGITGSASVSPTAMAARKLFG